MPTVLRIGPYAFVFFSSDQHEPPHIHVKRDQAIAKYWREPVSLANHQGLKEPELRKVARLVQQNRAMLIEAWHDFFGA